MPIDWVDNSTISRTKDQAHGDFASNLAMIAAKTAKKNPRELAQTIVAMLPASNMISKVEIAGPGFINFFLDDNARFAILDTIMEQKATLVHPKNLPVKNPS